jgi:hypothetical protein
MNLESVAATIVDIAHGAPVTLPGTPLPEGIDPGHPAWARLIRTILELHAEAEKVQDWAFAAGDLLGGVSALEQQAWALADARRAALDAEFQAALDDAAAELRDAA